MDFELNYDDLLILDAEFLAEGGIAETYEEMVPRLRRYVQEPNTKEEKLDEGAPRYSVIYGAAEFVIYDPNTDQWK